MYSWSSQWFNTNTQDVLLHRRINEEIYECLLVNCMMQVYFMFNSSAGGMWLRLTIASEAWWAASNTNTNVHITVTYYIVCITISTCDVHNCTFLPELSIMIYHFKENFLCMYTIPRINQLGIELVLVKK
jgi:hypothetical protein